MAAAEEAGAHLILVGLPGSGKSTVGRAAAEALRRRFVDFDEMIMLREGMSVSRIFAEKGEPYFRKLEREATQELRGQPAMVLAPGGGWITNDGVVALVRPPARLVYLKASPEAVLGRLGEGTQSRPLLQDSDPLGRIRDLLAARRAAYETADLVIDTELLTLQQVIDVVTDAGWPG